MAERKQERRLDVDNTFYTYEEFISWYGDMGQAKWDQAIREPTVLCEALNEEDGKFYPAKCSRHSDGTSYVVKFDFSVDYYRVPAENVKVNQKSERIFAHKENNEASCSIKTNYVSPEHKWSGSVPQANGEHDSRKCNSDNASSEHKRSDNGTVLQDNYGYHRSNDDLHKVPQKAGGNEIETDNDIITNKATMGAKLEAATEASKHSNGTHSQKGTDRDVEKFIAEPSILPPDNEDADTVDQTVTYKDERGTSANGFEKAGASERSQVRSKCHSKKNGSGIISLDSEAKNESDVVNPNTEKVTKHTARLSTSSSEPQMPNGNHNSGAQEEPPANEIDDALREAIEIGNPLPLKKLFADMRFTWEFGVKHLISKLDQAFAGREELSHQNEELRKRNEELSLQLQETQGALKRLEEKFEKNFVEHKKIYSVLQSFSHIWMEKFNERTPTESKVSLLRGKSETDTTVEKQDNGNSVGLENIENKSNGV